MKKNARTFPQFFSQVFLSFLLCSCFFRPAEENAEKSVVTIVTWNVQALFNGAGEGTEYNEYTPQAGWSNEKYRSRLDAIAEALESAVPGGPDVLALQEIENEAVLRDLAETSLSRFEYRWAACAHEPGAALSLGLLSRLPLANARVHALAIDGLEGARPILEVDLGGFRPFKIFLCHWKSKLGGADETEELRRAQARVLARRLNALAANENGGREALVLGDLNENDNEFFRRGGAALTALLPDHEKAASLVAEAGLSVSDCLVLSSEKPPRSTRLPEAAALYSPWNHAPWEGSYFYNGEWERIDHVLANAALFDGISWEIGAFAVLDSSPFIDSDGRPVAYNPRTRYGLSDHLPLMIELRYLD